MIKYLLVALVALMFTGCANLPKFDVTTPKGKNFAHTDNKVSYYQDGHQITCIKEADVWDCSYTNEDGLIVKIEDIDTGVLEEQVGGE